MEYRNNSQWKKETNIIEDYTVGYKKIYGLIDNYNNPYSNENTFSDNNHYLGWNLTVPAYKIYKTNNNATYDVKPGTVFKINKSGVGIFYETLTKICKTSDNILFFENSYENYNGGEINIEGLQDDTNVNSGKGTTTITLSKATTQFIPRKNNCHFFWK